MAISADLTSLTPGALVELFVLDNSAHGGDVLRFHAGTNELSQPVVWQGYAYTRLAVKAEGFERNGSGSLPRPRITAANFFITDAGERVSGFLSQFARLNGDFLGATCIRKRTFARYLDAVNFAAGNAEADPNSYLPDEVWRVDRISGESNEAIQWELASPIDVPGAKIPARKIVANLCTARYRVPETGCTWVPDPSTGPWFDILGNPVASEALDRASKRLSTCCAVRFGEHGKKPYMGYPAAGLIR